MRPFVTRPAFRLKGKIFPPGDKSIAHRYIIIGALSRGLTKIANFPANKDCFYTIQALRKLGIKITGYSDNAHKKNPTINVFAKGRFGLTKPGRPIFVGNSGTTLRLLLGVLAGQNFKVILHAGESLSRRPMLRVTRPLRMMGAKIEARAVKNKKEGKSEEYLPITIKGNKLNSISYRMPVASAQVKSALLLAALYAKGTTKVIEPVKTRDHTERILKLFKAGIKLKQNAIYIKGGKELIAPSRVVTVPGDISSAAFFITLASIIPDSQVLIRNVSLNPSRLGIIRVLKRMGADIQLSTNESGRLTTEPMGNILARSSNLKGAIIRKKEIPSLIDELPVLMVAASLARGRTVFEGVGELRVKETDRIDSMMENLKRMSANIGVFKEGKSENIIIKGVKELKGARVRSFADHRTAMSMVVAGFAARGETKIDDISCISKSYPEFINHLKILTNR
ncbi:MAG: 3-phosphoshikimate 1-carboxyvinyltransferase [Candidatus Omnitrophica bacterium]|nr:3-phosphoshikimate 1-carboxyvinyltransferase [Candidatus Omnitrophota bacterium]